MTWLWFGGTLGIGEGWNSTGEEKDRHVTDVINERGLHFRGGIQGRTGASDPDAERQRHKAWEGKSGTMEREKTKEARKQSSLPGVASTVTRSTHRRTALTTQPEWRSLKTGVHIWTEGAGVNWQTTTYGLARGSWRCSDNDNAALSTRVASGCTQPIFNGQQDRYNTNNVH